MGCVLRRRAFMSKDAAVRLSDIERAADVPGVI